MTLKQLLKIIRMLPEKTPIHAAYEKGHVKRFGPRQHWSKSQKEHWEGWLADYADGLNPFARENLKVDRVRMKKTGKQAFNRIMHAPMLLWLAEAAGVSKGLVLRAKKIALAADLGFAQQCAGIRKIIPWAMVTDCLLAKTVEKLPTKTKLL